MRALVVVKAGRDAWGRPRLGARVIFEPDWLARGSGGNLKSVLAVDLREDMLYGTDQMWVSYG